MDENLFKHDLVLHSSPLIMETLVMSGFVKLNKINKYI